MCYLHFFLICCHSSELASVPFPFFAWVFPFLIPLFLARNDAPLWDLFVDVASRENVERSNISKFISSSFLVYVLQMHSANVFWQSCCWRCNCYCGSLMIVKCIGFVNGVSIYCFGCCFYRLGIGFKHIIHWGTVCSCRICMSLIGFDRCSWFCVRLLGWISWLFWQYSRHSWSYTCSPLWRFWHFSHIRYVPEN